MLSAGHGSVLLYSLLHLTGYDLPLDELRSFRQWGSRTPGHPESRPDARRRGDAPGRSARAWATRVGMAIAEAHLAARYNRPGHEIFDHRTFVLASDGDLMEGVAAEAASLAGHLRLGKLICPLRQQPRHAVGTTRLTFTEDVGGALRGVRLAHRYASPTATTSRRSIARCAARSPRPSGHR